jgi:hypothetical protein
MNRIWIFQYCGAKISKAGSFFCLDDAGAPSTEMCWCAECAAIKNDRSASSLFKFFEPNLHTRDLLFSCVLVR